MTLKYKLKLNIKRVEITKTDSFLYTYNNKQTYMIHLFQFLKEKSSFPNPFPDPVAGPLFLVRQQLAKK